MIFNFNVWTTSIIFKESHTIRIYLSYQIFFLKLINETMNVKYFLTNKIAGFMLLK